MSASVDIVSEVSASKLPPVLPHTLPYFFLRRFVVCLPFPKNNADGALGSSSLRGNRKLNGGCKCLRRPACTLLPSAVSRPSSRQTTAFFSNPTPPEIPTCVPALCGPSPPSDAWKESLNSAAVAISVRSKLSHVVQLFCFVILLG